MSSTDLCAGRPSAGRGDARRRAPQQPADRQEVLSAQRPLEEPGGEDERPGRQAEAGGAAGAADGAAAGEPGSLCSVGLTEEKHLAVGLVELTVST